MATETNKLSSCTTNTGSFKTSSSSTTLPSALSMTASNKIEAELSSLWDSGQEWILIFDNLLKHPMGKQVKGCKCDMCLAEKGPSYLSAQNSFSNGKIQKSAKDISNAVMLGNNDNYAKLDSYGNSTYLLNMGSNNMNAVHVCNNTTVKDDVANVQQPSTPTTLETSISKSFCLTNLTEPNSGGEENTSKVSEKDKQHGILMATSANSSQFINMNGRCLLC